MSDAKNLIKDLGVSLIPYFLVATGVASALSSGDFTGGANHAIHLGTIIAPPISVATTYYYPRDNSKKFVSAGSRMLSCFKLAAATVAGAASIAAGVYTYAQTQIPANLYMTGAAVSTAIVAGFCLHRQARKARQARNNPQFFAANDSHETLDHHKEATAQDTFLSWAVQTIRDRGKEFLADTVKNVEEIGPIDQVIEHIRAYSGTRPVIAPPAPRTRQTPKGYQFVSTSDPRSWKRAP